MFTKGYDRLSIVQLLAELGNFPALEGASAIEELRQRLGLNINPQLVVGQQRSEFTSAMRAGRAFGEMVIVPPVAAVLSRFQLWNDSNQVPPLGQATPTMVLPVLCKVNAAVNLAVTLTLDNAMSGGFTEAPGAGVGDGMINLLSGVIGDADGSDRTSGMGSSAQGGPGVDPAGFAAIPASPAAHRLLSHRILANSEVDIMAGSGMPLPWVRPGRGLSIFGGTVNTGFTVSILWMEVPFS